MKQFLSRQQWWLQVFCILVVAIALRIPLLNGSFWLDEAAQAIESTRSWQLQFQIAEDFQPPLYHLVVHALQYVSWSEWWLRLASMIPGIGSVFLLIVAVRKWSTPKAALLAGLLLAISNIHLFFSQELRPYMWAVLWAMASFYSFSVWVQTVDAKEQTKWLRVLTIVNALGVLSSYVYIFWWMAQWLLMLLMGTRHWKSITASFLVSSSVFFVWWPWFLEQWQVGQTLRAKLPGWAEVVSVPFFKAVPLTLGKFLSGVVELDLSPVFFVTVAGWWLIWGLSVAWVWWQTRRGSRLLHTGLTSVLFLFGATLVIAWIFTLITPVLAPKRVLYILPLVLASLGFVTQYSRKIGSFVVIWFILWQGFATWSYWNVRELQREDWRSLTQEIEANFSAHNTALVFAFDGPFPPWDWYEQESWRTYSTGTKPPVDVAAVQESLAGIENYENILVFDYLRDLTDPERKIDVVLAGWGYDEVGAITYTGIGPVRMLVRRQLFATGEN